MSKETFDMLSTGTDAERAATFKDAPKYDGPRAQSSDPMVHIMIDLTSAAVKAWETVRDFSDATKVVAIALNPEVYVQVAFAAVMVDLSKGRDEEQIKGDLAQAMLAASGAQTAGASGPSTQSWGGLVLVPDARIGYMGVGIGHLPAGATVQVFDEAQYEKLKTSLKQQLKLDAFDAAAEKISVPGIAPGNA